MVNLGLPFNAIHGVYLQRLIKPLPTYYNEHPTHRPKIKTPHAPYPFLKFAHGSFSKSPCYILFFLGLIKLQPVHLLKTWLFGYLVSNSPHSAIHQPTYFLISLAISLMSINLFSNSPISYPPIY